MYMVNNRHSRLVCTWNKGLSFVDRRQYDFFNLFGSKLVTSLFIVVNGLFKFKQSCLLARSIVFVHALLLFAAFCFIF